METYKGVIIEESLENTHIIDTMRILSTKIDPITDNHKTPWIRQWTKHLVEIPDDEVEEISKKISHSLDQNHPWYADFKNSTHHYIIFHEKIFSIDRKNKNQYAEAKRYGLSLGIPEYQVDFHPEGAEAD